MKRSGESLACFASSAVNWLKRGGGGYARALTFIIMYVQFMG